MKYNIISYWDSDLCHRLLKIFMSLHASVFSDKYSFLKYEKYIYIENELWGIEIIRKWYTLGENIWDILAICGAKNLIFPSISIVMKTWNHLVEKTKWFTTL